MGRKLRILGILAAVALLLVSVTGSALAAPPNPTPGPSNYGFGFLDGVTLQRVATLLGTTTDDVVGQLQQGQTLAQIAQAKNVTSQALTDTLLQSTKDQLDLQVKYGYMSQDRANATLQNEQTRVNNLINTAIGPNGNNGNNGYGYGPYGGGMMGGYGGMMGGGWGGMMNGFGGMMNGVGGFMHGLGNMMNGFGGMMGAFSGATGNSGSAPNGFGGRGMMGR